MCFYRRHIALTSFIATFIYLTNGILIRLSRNRRKLSNQFMCQNHIDSKLNIVNIKNYT